MPNENRPFHVVNCKRQTVNVKNGGKVMITRSPFAFAGNVTEHLSNEEVQTSFHYNDTPTYTDCRVSLLALLVRRESC